MTDQPDIELASQFEPATYEMWAALAAKVIKGADFEARLVSRTADGIRIEPLYTRRDAIAEAQDAWPGSAPFTRGTGARRGELAWDIRTLIAEPDPVQANVAILADLRGGATSLALQIAAPGQFGLPYTGAELASALAEVELDKCAIALRPGEYAVDAAGSLLALWRERGTAESQRTGAFGADPLGTLAATGSLYHPALRALEIAARLLADSLPMPHVTVLVADGHIYHAAGASEAQELAYMLATLVAYLRACEAAGVAPEQALPKIAVRLAVDTDQFLSIAKLRAARRLVWRVAEAAGAGAAAAGVQCEAQSAWRMMARRDPWVNMLRTTVACAAAAMGGADSVCVLPFTWALGRPDAFARRIARNTQIVLMEEGSIGRVSDPAGGSWYVEKLTDELARKAWQLFQGIEARGGMAAALESGFIAGEIAPMATARRRQLATGELELTGVSAFPKLGKDDGVEVEQHPAPLPAGLNGTRITPLRSERLAAPFERLRDAADAFASKSGHPPTVFLATLGPLAEASARIAFATNFMAAGGLAVLPTKGFTNTAELGKAFAASGLAIACLCASDRTYALQGEAAAMVLKQAGATQVLMAGRPADQEATLRAAGVDGFIDAGCDALAALAAVHKGLGIAGGEAG